MTIVVCCSEPLSIDTADELSLQLVPAVARQAALKVCEPTATPATARVAAGALKALQYPAELVFVEVSAFSSEAWSAPDRGGVGQPAGRGVSHSAEHCCVASGGVLIDACLDLLSVPGGSLSLRPSWFELPGSWFRDGYAAFRQRQTGAVVSYRRVSGADETVTMDGSGSEMLVQRLAVEVAELCRTARHALVGARPAPSRWAPLEG